MTALLLLCCTAVSAADFEVDGIYYNILSSEDKTVKVTRGSNKYTGAVTIPASVTYNGEAYCVTSIGYRAFTSCYGLTSVEIPSSVTSIGDRAFYYCPGLTSIEIPASVTSIGEFAFSACSGLTSIVIPASVTSIGDRVFLGCSGLTSIEIPASVTSIGEFAFSACSGLTSVTIANGVTSIEEYAFHNCRGFTSIEIPSSVTSIGWGAFENCDGLTSIVVGDGNSVYDSRGNCNAIIETASNTLIIGCKNTIIPSSVTSIGGYAFYDCTGLTSIVIPEGVTIIGDWAFSDCYGLTSVEIPSSVSSIGNDAFYWCDGLTSITSHIAAENLFVPGNLAFYRIDKDACTLYVPAGAKSTYAATDGWKEFTNIVEMNSDGSDATAIESVESEQGEAVYYDLSGRRVQNPAKGICIVNGRKVFIK